LELLFATASLFAITLVAALIYYRRIREAQGEYEGAKVLVESIILGFNRQISRLSKSIEGVKGEALKAQLSSSEALKASVDALATARDGFTDTRSLANRIDENEKTVNSIKAELQRLAMGVRPQTVDRGSEVPAPLLGESIIDQLTETEVEVLIIIDELGEASAPEIKRRIEKTREHTARLLKKLYEKGFIDRNTSSMPYKYYIRKEIKEAIRQRKNRISVQV
jgi:chromosome segregation and condensation protein ScpB